MTISATQAASLQPFQPRRKTALIIGSGIGGLSLGIRLQSLGFNTTILERLDAPGGRAYQRHVDGYTFDMGPTVITVPQFIEELFALQRDEARLSAPDFPDGGSRVHAERPHTEKYVKLVPISPFYRIYFDDGTFFDYDGDLTSTRTQIEALAPEDLSGYEQFLRDAGAIFERGFLELGYTHFGDLPTMLRAVPDLLKLDAVRTLFSFTRKYFQNPKMQQVFSFETLLIGGNPLSVPAIYAMIHFVEKTWGIHYAIGGTGALVRAFVKKFEELGGTIRYGAGVSDIVTEKEGRQQVARGVKLEGGEELCADIVVSNGDWANTYLKRLDKKVRKINSDTRVKLSPQSMSLLVIYFGFRDDPECPLKLRHHNIILGPRYEELLREIFGQKVLGQDFSQYLHVPTLTDPALAPAGHHAAYTLVPVPNNASGLDWTVQGPLLVDRVMGMLDDRGYIPGLRNRLTHLDYVTPDYFADTLDSYLGNAFGPEPVLAQSAFFRPHNRSEDVTHLYMVGAGAQPGAGTPSVMMSAKMTARLVAEDFGIHPDIVG
ncbi:phytoene desaturase family protein [Deinococcus rubellus]|uniref:Phytoene desaturase family protein n=1 Tax=Deinococcus rubellus TaxID=1889240 RepID=A0ABY5YFK3_9DEIO|nr:phytoene desaturase family protein [Deinococcus rubellus]UWX62946.1 phytoene desaturase family protein [Deinococcus rubellus]